LTSNYIPLKGNIKWVRSLGQAVFLKEYAKSIWNFSGYCEVKEASIALEQEKEKLSKVIQSTNSGTWQWNIQTDETHHKFGLISWGIHSVAQ
jgi:hypothetical protein